MPSSQNSGDTGGHSPVSPVDIVQPQRPKSIGLITKDPLAEPHPPPPSLQVPGTSSRLPRSVGFAESRSAGSPMEIPTKSPFADPPVVAESSSKPTVADVGFGYVAQNASSHEGNASDGAGAARGPLKSALKTPGTPGRFVNPLSPTFREEQILEHHEKDTEKENEKDVKVKTRVRIAKMLLRGINFSCSLIIVALLAHSFIVFNATRNLASRNNLTPWAPNTNPWPQILVLVVACITLFLSVAVFYGYCKGGHKRAEKVGVYYTVFAVFFFAVTVVMWVVAAAVLQNSMQSGEGKDLWGWACKDNARSQLFHEIVPYSLVCRLQDWVLVCIIIEVVVDTVTIAIYGVVFYRFYSKRKLRKSMDTRDKARSDLYLAHLRSQSAPNTPGYPLSPGSSHFPRSPKPKADPYSTAEYGEYYAPQFAAPAPISTTSHQPFQLQRPPIRSPTQRSPPTSRSTSPTPVQRVNGHIGPAPGEKTYESVPIPNSYGSPISSPTFTPQQQFREPDNTPGMAVTTDQIVQHHKP